MKENGCLGNHKKGLFKNSNIELNGLEKEFYFEEKFMEEDSKETVVDPDTGIKSDYEPHLLFCIYFKARGDSNIHGFLRYGLNRHDWEDEDISSHSNKDEDNLKTLAKPRIKEDLEAIKRGQEPKAYRGIEFLSPNR